MGCSILHEAQIIVPRRTLLGLLWQCGLWISGIYMRSFLSFLLIPTLSRHRGDVGSCYIFICMHVDITFPGRLLLSEC